MTQKVSVIIPVWNPGELILHCVSALRQQTYQNLQIVLVDNHSVTPVTQIFQNAQQDISDLLIVTNEVNLGFSGGVNRGIVESDGVYLVILNQDVELFPDAIEQMIDALSDVSVGIVGGTLLYRDQRIQHVGAKIAYPSFGGEHPFHGQLFNKENFPVYSEPDFLTGALWGLRRELIDEIGYLDATFWPGYYEDVDFCYRCKNAGKKLLFLRDVIGYHKENTSIQSRSVLLFYVQHNRLLFACQYFKDKTNISDFLIWVRHSLETNNGIEYHSLVNAILHFLQSNSTKPKQWRLSDDEFQYFCHNLIYLLDQALNTKNTVQNDTEHSERLIIGQYQNFLQKDLLNQIQNVYVDDAQSKIEFLNLLGVLQEFHLSGVSYSELSLLKAVEVIRTGTVLYKLGRNHRMQTANSNSFQNIPNRLDAIKEIDIFIKYELAKKERDIFQQSLVELRNDFKLLREELNIARNERAILQQQILIEATERNHLQTDLAQTHQVLQDERTEIARLHQVLKDERTEIARLHQVLKDERTEIARLHQVIEKQKLERIHLQDALQATHTANVNLNTRLSDIEHSTSWRVTRPLRAIGKLFRKPTTVSQPQFAQPTLEEHQLRIQQYLNLYNIERLRGWHNRWLRKIPILGKVVLVLSRMVFLGRVFFYKDKLLSELCALQVAYGRVFAQKSEENNNAEQVLESKPETFYSNLFSQR